ncbi:MAG: ATP-dependent DNA ligase [Rhodothermales bacterium]|nr:ATP-dependent DNA ligase [Rhodothermales bacterium]
MVRSPHLHNEPVITEARVDSGTAERGIRVGGHWISLTHVERVLYKQDGISKQHLIEYYYHAVGLILRYVRNRPLMMERAGWRNGSIEDVFVQQRPSPNFPPWINRVEVAMKGGVIEHVVCNDAATIIYLVNQGMITPHVWTSRIDAPNVPDQVVFDLDPGEGGFDVARTCAVSLKEVLEERGLAAFVMTTGSHGLHVRTPIRREHEFSAVRGFARQLADHVAAANQRSMTTQVRKKKREGRLYIDTLRNSYGQNSVAPYAVRARRRAPVATPLEWEELHNTAVTSDAFNLSNIRRRLTAKPDPWRKFYRHARRLRL